MKRRTFLALLAGTPVLGSLGYLVSSETSAQESGDQATVAALRTRVSLLQTEAALQTQVAGLETQVSTKAPATAVAEGTATSSNVLYQTGKTGFERWGTPSDWHYYKGMLITDGANLSSGDKPSLAPAPYQPSVTDYAVEAEIQVVKGGQVFCGTPVLGVFVHGDNGSAYMAGVKITCGDHLAYITDSQGQQLGSSHFDEGTSWRTYRLEVQGPTIRLLIDGSVHVDATDNRLISNDASGIGLFYTAWQINVRSFQVLRLQ